jgi:hypothetical protein
MPCRSSRSSAHRQAEALEEELGQWPGHSASATALGSDPFGGKGSPPGRWADGGTTRPRRHRGEGAEGALGSSPPLSVWWRGAVEEKGAEKEGLAERRGGVRRPSPAARRPRAALPSRRHEQREWQEEGEIVYGARIRFRPVLWGFVRVMWVDDRLIGIGRPQEHGAHCPVGQWAEAPGRRASGRESTPHRAVRALAGCGPSDATGTIFSQELT